MQRTSHLRKHWGWTFNNGGRREDTHGVSSVGQSWEFQLRENHLPWAKESVLGRDLVRREEKPTQEKGRGRIYSGQVHRQGLLPEFQVNSLIQFLHLNKKLSGRVVGKIIWYNKYKAPGACLAHSWHSINDQVCLDLSGQKCSAQFSELVLAHCPVQELRHPSFLSSSSGGSGSPIPEDIESLPTPRDTDIGWPKVDPGLCIFLPENLRQVVEGRNFERYCRKESSIS